ncbi:MAG: response regulator, partial [Colwellia sp.]|nr:response regulator [Colwellia sp.]
QVKGKSDLLAAAINQIVENLEETARQADSIAQGDYTAEVTPRSDKDALGKALFLMTQSLREAGEVCDAIAKGDYSLDIQPKSDRDKLGKSLSVMTKNLRDVTSKSQRENWIKTGQAELANAMRGELGVAELSEQVITYIAKYTGAQVGVFYLADEARNLSLVSSYAYQRRKNLSDKIAVGEGIVGQAVKEKQTIMIANVPEDYISVNSGLGQASPNNLMVSPLLLEGSVKGAIEIGRFGEFDDKTIELLERSNESIAMAINSAHDRVRMQDLLEEAQRSGEELQAQQEELRASNEELEEQTKTIMESESSLKAQQEELQASNEELEEKTEYLQRQKQEILDKNIKIESSRKQLEDKASELEVSSKYKSEFLANMSHELRTPLNSLLILSELLSQNKEGNLTDKQLESATIIHRGGQDLLDLINDILDLSKVESGKLTLEIQSIELEQLERSICSQFEPLIHKKDFEFSSELAAGLPKVIQTDQMRTLQILKNLMSNAFKFTMKGSVVFRIFVPSSDVVFKQSHLNKENCIGFSVIDTGIGIEQDKQRLIFEAFQQADGSTSRKFGGTGLGLTISRELCRLLGGELQITSEYNKGSTFTVYLPLLNDGLHGNRNKKVEHLGSTSTHYAKEHTVKPITLPAVETNGYIAPFFIEDDRNVLKPSDKSVLIIEDDKDFSSVLKGISKEKGYKVLVAGDGKSALHLAAKYQPSAIILDLGLPDLDGGKVLDLFKSDLTTRHIPVHIISAREDINNGLYHGAIGVLQKPTSAVELNKVFTLFNEILNGEPKKLMIIDDDENHCRSLAKLLDNDGIEITEVYCGEKALELMKEMKFDCIVLDLHLPGISGQELLLQMHESTVDKLPPVVINTGAELSEDQYRELSRYTDKIILKGTVSNERLLDEVMLFLHQTPLSLPDPQRNAIQMLHNEESFFEGRTLLLVDDDLRNTFALSTVLEDKGLNVIIAENGLKALEALEKHDNIEVVLMDIMMPIMDGYEAMKEIRAQEKYHDLPIIALTAKAMAEDKAKCLAAGANDYMNKPVKADELLALLKVSIS